MSDSFINGHVAGVSCIRIHYLLPHIGGTVHSNTVICLDIAILRSFFKGSQCYIVIFLQHNKNVTNC